MKRNFEDIFDDSVKKNIKSSFDDVVLSDDLINKVKIQTNNKKSLKDKINQCLNYEVEILVGQIGVVAAILVLIPLGVTVKEYKNIMDNKIEPINISRNLEKNN